MAVSGEFPGVGDRLRAAFRDRGFWPRGRKGPQITEFCRRYAGYDRRAVARWLNPRARQRPSLPRLQQLAKDLETSVAYLLLGPAIFVEPEWSRLLAIRQRSLDQAHDETIPGGRKRRD
jgi:transcriptional regulator with XRE-family HTH domain